MRNLVQLHQPHFINKAISYLLGFMLLVEWLRPLAVITDTGSINTFVLYAAFCFIVTLLNMNVLLGTLLKGVSLLYILNYLFIHESFLSTKWIIIIYQEVIYNIGIVLSAQWLDMTNLFRSLLFLILLWLISYLIYYWFIQTKRILFFLSLTVIYVGVLDTFTSYSGQEAIVRIFIFGFISMGLVHLLKMQDEEKVRIGKKAALAFWYLPLVLLVITSTLVGFNVPKAEPQWPDPVPYLKNLVMGNSLEGSGGLRKIGYGTNDSLLGGSFIHDNATVFTAIDQGSHYWKVETKDHYTGRGWEQTIKGSEKQIIDGAFPLNTFTNEVDVTKSAAVVTFETRGVIPHVPYPVGTRTIVTQENVILSVDTSSEKILPRVDNGKLKVVDEYHLTYDQPSFSIKELQDSGSNDPDHIKEIYTQLPETVPDRVKQLAQQITDRVDNRYDAAKEIEEYFRFNFYQYETKDVAIPEPNQDYVDQFLFETKMGYCDNFSTSMVVLLRSVGIPARWVKGYTAGEYTEQLSPNQWMMEISNNNAHSWVEVYFPGQGWVPFEPTIGFDNPTRFVYDYSQDQGEDIPQGSSEEYELPTPDLNEENVLGKEFLDDAKWSGVMNSFTSLKNIKVPVGKIILYVTITAFIILIVYWSRRKWLISILMFWYKMRKDDKVYDDAFRLLVKVLERYGVHKKDSQTLREYAVYVDRCIGSQDMITFVKNYERILYRRDNGSDLWKQSMELWENLIKRLAP